jgi:hypothetical protein
MRSLLTHTFAELPQAEVFVASILNMPANNMPCVIAFNKALPGIVKEFQHKNMQVAYVPMNENTPLCGDKDRCFAVCKFI